MHDSVFFWLGRGKLTIRYVPGRDGGELERLVEHLEAGLPLENQPKKEVELVERLNPRVMTSFDTLSPRDS